MNKSEIFTLSNLLSFFRIFLAIPIYYFISISQNDWVILIILVAMLTDWLDGYFARKFNQVTDLGKILDPFADKVCTTSGFVALTIFQEFPLWLTVVIIARDVVILLGSLFIIQRANVVVPSNIPGKITVLLITLLGLVFILNWHILNLPVIILVIIMICISAINYARVFLKNIKAKHDS